jgi:phosphate-selective porin OprO and OprP
VVASPSREEMLEERVRQLESMVRQLANQNPGAGFGSSTGAPPAGDGTAGANPPPGVIYNPPGNPGGGAARTPSGNLPGPGGGDPTDPNANYPFNSGTIAPGQGTPQNPAPSDRFEMPATAANMPLLARFGPGFQWNSEDNEFVLQFHDLTQVDYRGYQQGGQATVHDGFSIPRQWFMFSGRLQKPYEYFVSIQNAIDTVNMLDVFLNVHWDDRIQFKFGRYKTPFTYEFYALPIQGLINSERSLFFNNFGLNRSIGAQVWGQLFNKKLDYAAGLFNQNRNSYVDLNDSRAFLAFLNWRPFGDWIDHPLENLNVGGSVMYANANNVPNPLTLRTDVATSGNAALGIPFLTFNNNAREEGTRALWDAHLAYYYKHLSLVSEIAGGYQSYALTSNVQQRTKVSVDSFYVQAGYFITGETVSGRNVVKPIRNFDLRPGRRGPGAIELATRYNHLVMGNQVFTGGFSDPNQYSRSVYTTNVGFNWYWTQQIKWLGTWEHTGYGTPVVFAPGKSQLTSDTFWVRLQVFF